MDMFYTIEKLKSRVNGLSQCRYKNRKPIEGIKVKEDTTKSEKYPPAVDETWDDIKMGTVWQGRDQYLWLQCAFDVPNFSRDEDFVLLFDFGTTGGGHNSGFESILFVDKAPYQGVDSNHKEVFLGHEYSGKKVELTLKLWSGLEGGGTKQTMRHLFNYADYAILSKETDSLYYTAKNMVEAFGVLSKDTTIYYNLQNILERAFEKLDWSQPGNDAFYESVKSADDYIHEEIGKLPNDSPIHVTVIGHTHIDVAWLWTLKHTREKSARSFSTVLRLMERYPDYIFLQSQPQLYAYIKEDYPEIYSQIKERAAEGKWETDGAMWLEADCNISSGESLVRQILHGSRFFQEEFGAKSNYLWLPDVFGYSWALPQILKKSGIDTFMTTKISWNQYNRMPHDTFKWRGLDGTEILTHFITTPYPGGLARGSHSYTYNGLIDPEAVQGIYTAYKDKNINSELLLSYGYGDGGGGVTRDMLESRRAIDKIPGLPRVFTGKAADYFKKLHETFDNTENYVHTWDGELYLEYHRGTYTSQAFTKRYNRKIELACREAEILYSLLMKKGVAYPEKELYQSWEIILRNQFHDIIPGSSINEVYVDAREEYEQATEIMCGLNNNIKGTTEGNRTFTFFNSAGWEREGITHIDVRDAGHFVSGTTVLESVKKPDGYAVRLPAVKAMGSVFVEFMPGDEKPSKTPFEIGNGKITTPYYKIKYNSGGQLEEIFDIENNRQVLKGLGNCLYLFEDKPLRFDAWDIDLFHELKKNILHASKAELVNNTALYATIAFTYKFGSSEVVQNMVLYSNSRRIDFVTTANWQERQQLLKARFDVDIRATEAVYDIQYGHVKRPTHWNTSWDMAMFETVAHQWIDFSERGYGAAILNDCKYGHSVKDSTMSITLLKGGIMPDPEADMGSHVFTYSLLPHSGDFTEGKVAEEAWDLNNPFTAIAGKLEIDSIEIESDGAVMIDAIKKQEGGDGIIIRLHEHKGGRSAVTLKPKFSFKSWQEADLMERPFGTASADKTITLELTPFEIKTVLLV